MKRIKLWVVVIALIFSIFPIVNVSAESQPEQTVDLELVEPVLMSKPPFQYYISKVVDSKSIAKKTKKWTLAQKSSTTIPFEGFSTPAFFTSKMYEVPNPFLSIEGNIPEGIPTSYRGEMLVKAIKGKDHVLLIYGLNYGENRYLVVMDKAFTEVLYAFDFINYAISPKYIKADYDYIYQQIQWAVIEDGTLYISHTHNTYAKSSNGMNGYITAIRLADNRMLWRSASLVSNSDHFEIVGDVILSGYGFTAEKDYLYQIDKKTGKTLDRTLLKDSPDYMIKKNNSIYVYGYETLTQFLIK